jgi:hypothetical protein
VVVRVPSIALLLTTALLGAACGSDGGSVADATEPEAHEAGQEPLDATRLFVALPNGLRYAPPPRRGGAQMRKVFLDAGIDDVDVRRIRRDDGAVAVAVTLVDAEDLPLGDLGAGMQAGGGEVAPEEIDGVRFLVGTDEYGNAIAARTYRNAGVVVYAKTRSDVRSFARPFSRRLSP